jgi:hypothetical protein
VEEIEKELLSRREEYVTKAAALLLKNWQVRGGILDNGYTGEIQIILSVNKSSTACDITPANKTDRMRGKSRVEVIK